MVGDKIRELRKRQGLTQRELADKIGVRASTVGMYEQGRRLPDAAALSKLAEALGVTSDVLLNETPRELSDLIDSLRGGLALSGDVMFHGQPLTEEDVEAVVHAMKIGVEIALARKKNNG